MASTASDRKGAQIQHAISWFYLNKSYFKTSKIKLNSRTWLPLKSSVVIFQALEPLQPQWPLQPQQPQWPQWPEQPHFIKKWLILLVWWSLAPIWPLLVHFCGMDHQKSKLLLILVPFLSEAVEDSRFYIFGNWFVKLKFPNLLNPRGTIIQQNYWSLYPSELIYFALFTMRHPVVHEM